MYSSKDSQTVVRYTGDQIKKIEESIRVRKAVEPIKLISLVKKIKDEFRREDMVFKVPSQLKQKITDEIWHKLKASNASVQRDTIEDWRKKSLEEAKAYHLGKKQNSSIQPEEAGILVKALEANWPLLLEEIGLWLPDEAINKEHNDKPDNEDEFETPLAGRPLSPKCNVELHTDYDGQAVRWGLTHPKESAAECCEACLDQAKHAKPGDTKCNIWVYCPSETGCFSPDIYRHQHHECWLKFAENPRPNFKDRYSKSYRSFHPSAPVIIPWVSGVVST